MKYCSKCGTALNDDAIVCTKCGNFVNWNNTAVKNSNNTAVKSSNSGTQKAAKIFMIITCAFLALCATLFVGKNWIYFFACLIPLCWTIPMTVSYFSKTKKGESVSTGFKVCSLLFVNLIAGICMLCDND